MFSRSLLVALIFAFGPLSAQAQDQVEPISRPRRTQTTPTEADRRQAHADDAEAKRLYKDAVKYGRAGLYQQAAETLEQAVKLKPDYGEAYLSLGHAYYDMHRWQSAVDNIQRGLALKPHDNDSRKRLAQAQKMLAQQSNAKPAEADEINENTTTIGSSVSLTASTPPTPEPRTDDESPTKIYRVGAGDVLDVHLTGDASDQSTLFTVTAGGFIEHPNLNAPVQCAGLLVDEIAARIEDDLKTRGMKNSKVSVAVQEYISHTILVSGLVKEPGTKSLKREGIPLYVVVADAQPLAAAGRVTVRRSTWAQDSAFDLADTSALNMLVRPGDVVTLIERQAQFFYMSGQIKTPGEKPFHRGMTLTQAIMSAGGLNKDAKEAQVSRDNGKGFLAVTRYKLKDIGSGKVADPAIQPGDRINIID